MNDAGQEAHPVNRRAHELAERLLRKSLAELSQREHQILDRMARRELATRDIAAEHEESLSFGQRLADRVAAFGGSWAFISSFGATIVAWVALNSVLALRSRHAFDPYPFILLNLFLSMIASIQAPVIMMSQNRQSAKDRREAAHDYEVNLRAELEIMDLHNKIDLLTERIHTLESALRRATTSTHDDGEA